MKWSLAVLALLGAAAGASAQQAPADLTAMPPVPTTYQPKKTEWGDPDLRATFTLDTIANSRVAFSRPPSFGNRSWVTDAEFAERLAAARKSDAAYSANDTRGTKGLATWMENEPFARRTSMLVNPADGKLPPLTPEAEALRKAGRSSWVSGNAYNWLDDFDTWDRCISRGFPASMLPFHYNNGVRIFQAPGFVVIHFEMLGDRIIPVRRDGPHRPGSIESWMGSSVGHWEGNTLVVETTGMKTGDGATHDLVKRAASPLNVATGVPSNNAIPVSDEARAQERFTPTGPSSLVYELTYSDPKVFSAPWTSRVTWTRDDSYRFFEYACHEGNVSIRNNIMASRAERRTPAPGSGAGKGL